MGSCQRKLIWNEASDKAYEESKAKVSLLVSLMIASRVMLAHSIVVGFLANRVRDRL